MFEFAEQTADAVLFVLFPNDVKQLVVEIGGIFDEAKTNDYEKVPFFGDLPVIGHLFKNSVKTNQQSELLIFITPRIVNDTLSRNH